MTNLRKCLFVAMMLYGLNIGAGQARSLDVEMEVLHLGGMLTAEELERMLMDQRLTVEITYIPNRLVDGKTARREKVLPLGSQLIPILQREILSDAQIQRKGRFLHFQVPEQPVDAKGYRIQTVTVLMPIAAGIGRPTPNLEIHLIEEEPATQGAHENVMLKGYGTFDLGLLLRVRWSDASDKPKTVSMNCHPDIHSLGNGQYQFRSRHRFEGLYDYLNINAQSGSIKNKEYRSWQLSTPYPSPITGWNLSRNVLIQKQVDGASIEFMSIYATQAAVGVCQRNRLYNVLFVEGQPVRVSYSHSELDCSRDGVEANQSIEAKWLDGGQLSYYNELTSKETRNWDSFNETAPATCRIAATFPKKASQALKADLIRLRQAFLRK